MDITTETSQSNGREALAARLARNADGVLEQVARFDALRARCGEAAEASS